MKQLFYLFFISISLLLASCQQGGFSIKGSISDAQNLSVYFDKVNPVSLTNSVVAKGETNGSGNFTIVLEEPPAQGTYRIRVGAKSVYLIMNGVEKAINIKGSLKDIGTFTYDISGSDLSTEYANKIKGSLDGSVSLESLSQYATTQADPMIGMMIAMQRFSDVSFAPLHSAIAMKLLATYPTQEVTQEYVIFANGLQ